MADKIFTFEIDDKSHAKLKKISEDERRTMAGQVRFIIDEWIENQDKLARRKGDK